MSETNLTTFIPITKVNAERREVWGVLAEEAVDKSGEIMDYATSKPNFEAWANGFAKATEGKSMGNLRAMHGNIAAGKLVSLEADDVTKTINIGAKVVDDGEWNKVLEGVYTGFSVGGSYAKRWHDATLNAKRYTAMPAEASLVDNPCMHGATFEVIKADGSAELHKFVGEELPELGKILSDLQKAGARHSSGDNKLIQEIHDAGCALGATCTAEKMAKSYDEEPGWVAYVAGCDIADTAQALALIAGIASRLAERNADAAAKLGQVVTLLTEALASQATAQNAAIAASVVDAMTDEQIITDAGLERIASAVMTKLAMGDDAPLNKINGKQADTLTKADGASLQKSLDEAAAQMGALIELTTTMAKQMRAVGPIVRELPTMNNGSGGADPALTALDSLIAGETDMQTQQILMNKRAKMAIKSVHSGGGNPIR